MRSAAMRRSSVSTEEMSFVTPPPSRTAAIRSLPGARRNTGSAAQLGSLHFASLHAGCAPTMSTSRRLFHAGAQAEQVADGVDQVGAVHGVEMKVGDAAVDQVEHLLGCD